MTPKTVILTLTCVFCIAVSFAQSANFTAATTSGCSPLVVNFQDQSIGNPTNWFWDFGNGATSTLQNPSTTYFNPGTYTVKLTVTNAQGSNTLTRDEYITVYGKPTVSFMVNDSVSCFPARVQFTDLSSASTSTNNNTWLWDFGDGNQVTQQNPLHVYTNSGIYTVTLKVTNDKGCFGVLTKTSYIQVNGGVRADFTNTPVNVCRPPFPVSFTNNSTGPGTLTWHWDFGDGDTSNQMSPSHNYTNPGNYTVTMAITSTNGCSDTLTKTNLFNIQNITTSFSVPDSVCINAIVPFLNTSTPTPVSSSWIFGDGNTSNQINPVKSYSTTGNYIVHLYNTYSYCTDSFSKPIKILPRPAANFTAANTTKCQPSLTVNFQDQSLNAVSWLWDFGDGSTSNLQNPSHTYSNYGTFDVQLVVTNSSGCTDTLKKSSFVKIIRPQIVITPASVRGCVPYTYSPTANITTLDAVTSYSWDFGDGSPKDPSANPTHIYPTQGTYTVTLTITTSSGCTETATAGSAVTVGTHPTAHFNVFPQIACAFQNISFVDSSTAIPNGIDEWHWDFGDGATSLLQNPIHQYSDTGKFTVSLIVGNNGCLDSTGLQYIQVKPPVARFGFTTTCNFPRQFTFLDSSIGANHWQWDFGDGSPVDTTQKPTHIYSSLGSYVVSLTVKNDTCENTFKLTINNFKETPDFHATFTEACRRTTFYFYGDVTDPSNIVDYLWDFGDGQQWDSKNYNSGNYAYHYYPFSGNYTVTLVTTDIYGCKQTVVKTNYIRVDGPTAAFNTSNTLGCKSLKTVFNDLSTNDGVHKIVSWKWDFGDGTIQTFLSAPFQHTYTAAGNYSVKLVVTDATGCSDSIINANLITIANPKANFSSADTLSCPGAIVHFTDQSNATNYTSSWSFGDGNTSTANSPTNIYGSTGIYPVKLKIIDQYGCSDSITKPNYITVSKPVASFKVNDSISSCTPLEVDFTNTSQYYVSSLWNLNGGTSTLTNPIQFYTQSGTYPIKLYVKSPGGCMDSASKTIYIYDTAGSKVTYIPLNGCKPLSVDLNAFTPGPVTFTWDFGDGVLITNDSTKLNHIYNFFGNFVPKVIMTDPSGCIIPVSGLDTIKIIGATAKFGLDKKFFCDSGIVSFTDSTTFNDSLISYNWNFGDGNTSNLQNPIHNYTTPGFYTVSLNVQTKNSCVDTFTKNNVIKIVQSPLVGIGGDSVICVNDYMQHLGLILRTDTSAVTWSWAFPNGNSASIQNPVKQQYVKAGNFVVTTVVTNSSGCKDTATKNILINPLPVITVPSTITMQAGFPVTIPAAYSPNVSSYSWFPVETLSCNTCPQPIASPKLNTTYSISVVDSNGCKNASQVQIVIICKNANVFVPNTFSPNGDGSNDVFYVRGRGLERVKSLRIFNRWGQVVFEAQNFPVNDSAYGWDGKFNGHKPEPGVYVYQLEVFCDNSQIIHFDGNVALIQ